MKPGGSPFPSLLLQIRPPNQTPFLIMGKDVSTCLLPPEFSANPLNYSNKSTPSSHGNQGTSLPLVTTKPASLSLCWFTLFPGANLLWPCVACGFLLPGAVNIYD